MQQPAAPQPTSGLDARAKERERFQASKRGASFGIGHEVQCEGCLRYVLHIRRCGRCKLAWYCGEACQRAHYPHHKHVCAAEAQRRVAPSPPAPPQPRSSPRAPRPPAADLQTLRDRVQGQPLDALDLARFSAKEASAYATLLREQAKDVLESMWRTCAAGGRVALDGPSMLTVRELWKYAGSQPEFAWLAPRGHEWVGQYGSGGAGLDTRVADWLCRCMVQGGHRADDEGRIDYNTFVRMVCARAADYRSE